MDNDIAIIHHAADRFRLTDRQLKKLQKEGTLRVLLPSPFRADTPQALAQWTNENWIDYYIEHSYVNLNFPNTFQDPIHCDWYDLEGAEIPYVCYTFGQRSDAEPVFGTFTKSTPGSWDKPGADQPENYYKLQHIALAKKSRLKKTSGTSTQKTISLTREAYDALDGYYGFLFANAGHVSKQQELSRLVLLAIQHFGEFSEGVKNAARLPETEQQTFVGTILAKIQALRPMRRQRARRGIGIAAYAMPHNEAGAS